MRFFRQELAKLFWAMAGVCTLLAILAGCVISPRRVVVNGPSPTPIPTGTPTPGTTPPPTPSPTPTPTPMAATVSRQFLFLSDAGAPLITIFKINGDGSLAPIPGSPFPISAPARALKSAQDLLIVEGESGASMFKVNRETGLLEPAANALSASELQSSATSGPEMAVLDRSGRFMYVADVNQSQLLAFRIENERVASNPTAYPIPANCSSVALVEAQ